MNVMTMNILEAMQVRTSAQKYDTSQTLSEAEIKELVAYAIEAPSSNNVQPWRFIAVTEPAVKARLQAVAYNQPKVSEAAVTFIVLGDLLAYEKMGEIVARTVAAGLFDEAAAERSAQMTYGAYVDKPAAQHAEALRSTSLAAMQLMLAATGKGLVSCPMGGFDPDGVRREFNIAERYLPVMLITVGYAAAGNWGRKPRLEVDEVLSFNAVRDF